MSLELPPIYDLLRQLETRNRSVAESVAKTGDLKAERTVTAVVKEVASLSRRQLDALLAQHQSGSTAGLKQLLQKPQLWLSQLEISGPDGSQQKLLTVADRPLQAGDKLILAIVRNQWHVIETLAPSVNNNDSLGDRNRFDAIGVSLRSALPRHEPLSPLLKIVQAILKTTTDSPRAAPAQNPLLSPKLRHVLQSLLAAAKTPQQLRDPQQLKQSINNSGVLFEHKLHRALERVLNELAHADRGRVTDNERKVAGPPPDNQGTAARPALSRKLLGDIAQHFARRLQFGTNSAATSAVNAQAASALSAGHNAAPKADAFAINDDIKALLLQAKAIVEQERQTLLNLTTGQATTLSAALVKPVTANQVDKLIEQLLRPNASNMAAEQAVQAKETLLQAVYRQILTSLARIQLHQASSLTHSLNTADGNAAAPQQLHVEIPIRINNEFQQLALVLEEDWVEKSGGDENERKKVRQWSVTLDFDLQEAGQFYSRIRVVGDCVDIQFWAERDATLAAAQRRLAALQAELHGKGVVVNDIQCLPGDPPRRKFNIDYTLVDVRT